MVTVICVFEYITAVYVHQRCDKSKWTWTQEREVTMKSTQMICRSTDYLKTEICTSLTCKKT